MGRSWCSRVLGVLIAAAAVVHGSTGWAGRVGGRARGGVVADPDGYTPGGDDWATDERANLPATHIPRDSEWFPVDQVVVAAGPLVVPPTLEERLARLLRARPSPHQAHVPEPTAPATVGSAEGAERLRAAMDDVDTEPRQET